MTVSDSALRHRGSALAGAAVAACAFAVTWVLVEAGPGRFTGVEEAAFRAGNAASDAVAAALWPVMQLGNVWLVPAAALVAWAVWVRAAPAVTIVAAGVGAWLAAKVLKEVVARDRPAGFLADAVVREANLDRHGFPSGHAAVSFAVATALAPWLPRRWRVVPYLVAAGTGVARIVHGAHLPLDVVGGAALGVLCGLLARFAVGVPDDTTADADAPAAG